MNGNDAIVPERLASSIYTDILNASKNRSFKLNAIPPPAYALADDGSLTDERRVRFVKKFLNLADPRTQHHIQIAKVALPARPSPPLPKPTTIAAVEPPVALHLLGEISQVLLALSVIWLIVHLVRGRRTA